jgi:hypothetical protein
MIAYVLYEVIFRIKRKGVRERVRFKPGDGDACKFGQAPLRSGFLLVCVIGCDPNGTRVASSPAPDV